MANIEMNYYDGSAYTVLYPKIDLNNNTGTALSTSYVPNLSATKITSGTLSVARGGTGVTSYSSLASSISPYLSTGLKGSLIQYTGTGTQSLTSSPSISFGHKVNVLMIGGGTVTWAEQSMIIAITYGLTSTATTKALQMFDYSNNAIKQQIAYKVSNMSTGNNITWEAVPSDSVASYNMPGTMLNMSGSNYTALGIYS